MHIESALGHVCYHVWLLMGHLGHYHHMFQRQVKEIKELKQSESLVLPFDIPYSE